MSKSKAKICKIPTCNKEVYIPKALFCGEHERAFQDYRKKAGIVVVPLGAGILRSVVKRVIRKNHK